VKRVPQFRSEKEEAEFWDTHSFTEYLQDLESAELSLSPMLRETIKKRISEKVRITMWLNKRYIEEAQRIADKKGIPYQTLLREWVAEAIEKEEEAMESRIPR
jgi:predicted DNA binding CopG/RHH family protein